MLVAGIALLILGSLAYSYSAVWWVLAHLPVIDQPMGAWKPHYLALLTGIVLAVAGLVLLFIAKWYAGVIGILTAWMVVRRLTAVGVWLILAPDLRIRGRAVAFSIWNSARDWLAIYQECVESDYAAWEDQELIRSMQEDREATNIPEEEET